MTAELIIQTGKNRGKRLRLPDHDVVIGRDDACHVRLASSDVSRQHCVLRPSAEGLRVRDLESRNGTFVNDVFVKQETLLKPGDILRVGPVVFQVPPKREPDAPADSKQRPADTVGSLSDDEIAHWLAEDADSETMPTGDTTIITEHPVRETPDEAEPQEEPSGHEITQPPKPHKFASVAQEAQDIIRRHWDMVHRKEKEEGRDTQDG